MPCQRIILGGLVQGVGFRPFVYRLALRLGVTGWVRNRAGIVEICAQAEADTLAEFRAALLAEAPLAARPDLRAVTEAEFDGMGFEIRGSVDAGEIQGLPPDLAPCPDCLAEMADPGNRRYRYPFINCTQCGPRYSIIRALPYDRANTSMADFTMCPDCTAEYAGKVDRRFHAEPVACPVCGPSVRFGTVSGEAGIQTCLSTLRAGGIVAVKGVGGYHLLCDAADEEAVSRLRARKHRPEKPLALLLPEDMVGDYVTADDPALYALERPVLLLRRKPGARLASGIAPGLGEIGVMLPASPLHARLAEGFGAALVATSANRSGEPMVTAEAQAEAELAGIADGFLHHNRRIERAVDDSVLRVIDGAARVLRAGRGRSPIEFLLPFRLAQPVLAVGGHMKSSIALGFGNRVVVSPHLGELDNPAACAAFEAMAADLQALYGVRAEMLIADAHAGYASTQWAKRQGLPVEIVWHHHAHASAVAGEFGGAEMLVFTWDGVGLGEDGALWGGEALLGRPGAWRVVARMRRLRLQGGDAVAREPWRSGAAMCWQAGVIPPAWLAPEALAEAAWRRGLNCHESSAVGRLFDGASALLGLGRMASYEGQGPALLEALAGDISPGEALPLAEMDGVLEADWTPLVPMLLDGAMPPGERAARFHAALAATGVAIARAVDARVVGLAGGVFQNRGLTEALLRGLRARGVAAHLGSRIPCNDAGLSFGQIIEFGARYG
jgi:hydrogenase maturation protein HypF